MNVSIHRAKTQLSQLLDLVKDGESVVIERHGRPVAKLVPVRQGRASSLGAMRGKFEMTDVSGEPSHCNGSATQQPVSR